jgi:hypothetical protein
MTGDKLDGEIDRALARLQAEHDGLPDWRDEPVPRRRDQLIGTGRVLEAQKTGLEIARQKLHNLRNKTAKQRAALHALDARQESVNAERVRIGDASTSRDSVGRDLAVHKLRVLDDEQRQIDAARQRTNAYLRDWRQALAQVRHEIAGMLSEIEDAPAPAV